MLFTNVLAGTAISVVSSVAVGQVISNQAQWESQAVGDQLVLGGLVQTAGSFRSDVPIQIDALLRLDIAPDTMVHLGGDIENLVNKSNGILKRGLGTLRLTGNNTYRAGTELHQGSLWLGSDQALGNIASSFDAYLGTRLVYKPGVTISNTLQVENIPSPLVPLPTGQYANSLQWHVNHGVATHQGAMLLGAANVVKQGSGLLRLTGNSPETLGRFQVNQGGLAVDGIFLGNVQVHDGAWLQGQGQLGSATIAPGGVLAKPAGLLGLRIDRDLTFQPGSTYMVDVSASGAGQPIHVQGRATLAGLVQARTTHHLATQWSGGWEYAVLQADAGFGGTRFDSVAVDVPFLTPGLRYDAQHVYLTLGLNQQATTLWPFSGAWAASVASSLIDDSRYVRLSALRHLNQAPVMGPFLWADTYYADAERSADGGNPGDQRRVSGLILGVQQPWGKGGQWNAFVGFQATHMQANKFMDARSNLPLHSVASARINSVHIGLSAAVQTKGMVLALGAAHSWHQLRSQRQLAMGGLSDSLHSRYSARTAQVFAEIAANGSTLTPYARLAWVHTHAQGHTEAGGPTALTLKPAQQRVLFTTLGIRAQHTVATALGLASIHGDLAWRHAAGAIRPASQLQFAGAPAQGTSMSYGLPVSRHAIQLQAGVTAQLSSNATLRLAYAGQYGRGSQEHGIQLAVTVAF